MAGVTYRTTLGAAQRRIAADLGLALNRAAVDEILQKLRNDFDRERISTEQQQLNRRPFLQKQSNPCLEATGAAETPTQSGKNLDLHSGASTEKPWASSRIRQLRVPWSRFEKPFLTSQ